MSIICDNFHKLYEQRRVWERMTWLGVPMWKLPFDAFIIQELICKIRPDYIIETGTNFGGSSLFYASILNLLKKGRVITIDKTKKTAPDSNLSYISDNIFSSTVIKLIGDSVSDDIFKIVFS